MLKHVINLSFVRFRFAREVNVNEVNMYFNQLGFEQLETNRLERDLNQMTSRLTYRCAGTALYQLSYLALCWWSHFHSQYEIICSGLFYL